MARRGPLHPASPCPSLALLLPYSRSPSAALLPISPLPIRSWHTAPGGWGEGRHSRYAGFKFGPLSTKPVTSPLGQSVNHSAGSDFL